MADSALNYFVARGTNAERLAFTPVPPSPSSGPDPLHIFYETDTGDTYAWDGAAWDQVNTATSLADGDYGDFTFAAGVATIDAGAITLAKQANMATASVVYRKSGGAGAPEVQTLATLKTDLGLTGINSGDQTVTLTGDVTGTGAGSFAATIANGAVTYAKMQDVSAASKLVGRGAAGGSGDPEEITLGTNLSMSGTTLNAASGGAWTLAGTGQTATGVYDFAVDGAKANIDFAGLGSFNELLIIARGLTNATNGQRCLRVSVDGGSTFYAASGDYKVIDAVGVETNAVFFGGHSTNSTAARTFISQILNTKGTVKAAVTQLSGFTQFLFTASASDIDAIRVLNLGGGNMTGGTVRVYAR